MTMTIAITINCRAGLATCSHDLSMHGIEYVATISAWSMGIHMPITTTRTRPRTRRPRWSMEDISITTTITIR